MFFRQKIQDPYVFIYVKSNLRSSLSVSYLLTSLICSLLLIHDASIFVLLSLSFKSFFSYPFLNYIINPLNPSLSL